MVQVTHLSRGFVVHTLARDTSDILGLFELENQVYMSSGNGTIRLYDLAHNIKRSSLTASLWEHGGAINDTCLSFPTTG